MIDIATRPYTVSPEIAQSLAQRQKSESPAAILLEQAQRAAQNAKGSSPEKIKIIQKDFFTTAKTAVKEKNSGILKSALEGLTVFCINHARESAGHALSALTLHFPEERNTRVLTQALHTLA